MITVRDSRYLNRPRWLRNQRGQGMIAGKNAKKLGATLSPKTLGMLLLACCSQVPLPEALCDAAMRVCVSEPAFSVDKCDLGAVCSSRMQLHKASCR